MRHLQVELYWLSGNSSERWYATLPAGKRVEEITTPGQCWRARTPARRGGQHVASYCATSEPRQEVRIKPQERVQLDFHYPAAAAVGKGRATVYEVRRPLNGSKTEVESLVGNVPIGGHLAIGAQAGSVYRVRDETTRRPIVERFTAGFEAEQHVDVTSHHVALEFVLSPSTPVGTGCAVYWTWGGRGAFAREHLHSNLLRAAGVGESVLRVQSAPGEQWIVRRAARPGEGAYGSEDLLLEVSATAVPATQRHVVVVPPMAVPPEARH